MIVLFWLIGVLIITILLGEIRFRQIKAKRKNYSSSLIAKEWSDSIDRDIDILDVETSTSDIVPTTTLAMRGSWRLAQGMAMNEADFAQLRESEYHKFLQ